MRCSGARQRFSLDARDQPDDCPGEARAGFILRGPARAASVWARTRCVITLNPSLSGHDETLLSCAGGAPETGACVIDLPAMPPRGQPPVAAGGSDAGHAGAGSPSPVRWTEVGASADRLRPVGQSIDGVKRLPITSAGSAAGRRPLSSLRRTPSPTGYPAWTKANPDRRPWRSPPKPDASGQPGLGAGRTRGRRPPGARIHPGTSAPRRKMRFKVAIPPQLVLALEITSVGQLRHCIAL